MSKSLPSFRFEKGKLLSQKRRIELWSGSVDGQPQFIKRFLFRRPELRLDFLLQSKIVNPMFLRPLRGGFSEKGLFSYAMPANFPVSGLSASANDCFFLIEFLALIFALQRKGLTVLWDPSHFVFNSAEQRSFLAGFNRLCSESSVGLHEKSRRILFQLRKHANDMSNGSASARILKKWERRKKGQLEGCLQEFLSNSASGMDRIVTLLEWSWSKELELIRGFYQLAERGKGRSILFLCDPGEGKTTLIRQIQEEFVVRGVTVTHKMNQDEKRPYHAIRKLFEQFYEDMRSYKGLKDIQRMLLQLIHDSTETNQETIIESFLKIIAFFRSQHLPVLFLIDDADRYDAESINILAEMFRRIESLPVLFVMSSKTEIRAFDESTVKIPIQPAPLSRFLRSYNIPLWRSDQKNAFMEKIYDKTSGNPSLFHLYLMETLRGIGRTGILWKDGRWMFTRHDVPEFLSESRALCIQGLPHLSPDEQAFLETASVQGTEFDPSLIPLEESLRMDLLKTLEQKEVVSPKNGRIRFRKAIVADSFYCGIPSQKLRALHLSLASDLQEAANPETYVSISRHLLRAGEIGSSLEFACRAFQEGGKASLMVLPVLEEMEKHVPQMDPSSRFRLYKYRGEILFRRGHYLVAAENFKRAREFSENCSQVNFDLSVRIAQCHILSNDIFSAQEILQEITRSTLKVEEERSLMPFYFARGVCSWHRGNFDRSDFDRAFSIAERLEDYEALSTGYRQRAELALREGSLEEAESFSRKALRFANKGLTGDERGHALKILGSIAWRKSRYSLAENILRKSIRVFHKIGNFYGIAGAWNLLGNIHAERCRFDLAVHSFRKAIHLLSELDHPLEVGLAQFNLGTVLIEQSRIQTAEAIFLRCLALDKKSGNKRYVAYDLRALAVTHILRGYYRKAIKLLSRAAQIFEELNADGDIIQTRLILLLAELEQKEFKCAEPLVAFLQAQIPALQEPRTLAEIHYVCGMYFGAIGEKAKATEELSRSLRFSRRIGYFKLIAKNLVQKLILQNGTPTKNDLDFCKALRLFARAKNHLDEGLELLKLFQAHPEMLREKTNLKKLIGIKKLFKRVGNRAAFLAAESLIPRNGSQNGKDETAYDWWTQILREMNSGKEMKETVLRVLTVLFEELHSTVCALHFTNCDGIFERISIPEGDSNRSAELSGKVLNRMFLKRQSFLVNVDQDPEFSQDLAFQHLEINSVMAIPVQTGDQIQAMWHFERRHPDVPFTEKELSKASFFAAASTPALFSLMHRSLPHSPTDQDSSANGHDDLIGRCAPMRELFRQMTKLAPVDISVLILGESGTGKELIARSLHKNSRRVSGPFCTVNCSALPETLIESELFGHSRGAFTGAVANKPGWIEQANRGTFFLDEVGDLSAAAQAKLLRVIQEREVQRLGETTSRKIDVRFVFATHKDIQKMIKEGSYREDLYYRISTSVLRVPSLRDRSEDVPLLVNHLIEKYSGSMGKQNLKLAPTAMRILCEYCWPGNVRELENIIQSLMVNCDSDGWIEADDLPDYLKANKHLPNSSGMSLEEARVNFERGFLEQALNHHRWNKTQTARELKITRQGLINMIQRLGLKEQTH